MEIEARDQRPERERARVWCEMLPVRSVHLRLLGELRNNEVIFLCVQVGKCIY